MLPGASTALAKDRALRLGPAFSRLDDRFDFGAHESGALGDDPQPHPVPGDGKRNEDDSAILEMAQAVTSGRKRFDLHFDSGVSRGYGETPFDETGSSRIGMDSAGSTTQSQKNST